VNYPAQVADPVWLRFSLVSIPSAIAVCSAFVGVKLTNLGNAKIQNDRIEREKDERRRDVALKRGEELYILLEEWSLNRTRATNSLVAHKRHGVPLDAKDVETMMESVQILRAKFVVDVYFPALKPQMDWLGREMIRLGELHREVLDGKAVDEEAISAVRKSFRWASLGLQQAVINELKKLPTSD
jgi:hypothetical protein